MPFCHSILEIFNDQDGNLKFKKICPCFEVFVVVHLGLIDCGILSHYQEVKIGSSDVMTASLDLDEGPPQPNNLSSSPPQQNTEKLNTPPNSPNVGGVAPFVR